MVQQGYRCKSAPTPTTEQTANAVASAVRHRVVRLAHVFEGNRLTRCARYLAASVIDRRNARKNPAYRRISWDVTELKAAGDDRFLDPRCHEFLRTRCRAERLGGQDERAGRVINSA